MFKKEHLAKFNQSFLTLVCNECKVSCLEELQDLHIAKLKALFNNNLNTSIQAITDEWGIQPDWIKHIADFKHDFDDHIHSNLNPFGAKLLKDNNQFVVSPHLHVGDIIIGGDNIECVLKEIATSLANNRFDYVASRHCRANMA